MPPALSLPNTQESSASISNLSETSLRASVSQVIFCEGRTLTQETKEALLAQGGLQITPRDSNIYWRSSVPAKWRILGSALWFLLGLCPQA